MSSLRLMACSLLFAFAFVGDSAAAVRAKSPETGRLRFLAAEPGQVLQGARDGALETLGADFLHERATAFGLTRSRLRARRSSRVGEGRAVRFQQTVGGVPVIGGQLIVHFDASDAIVAVAGETTPDGVDTTPSVDVPRARAIAKASIDGAARVSGGGLRIYAARLTAGSEAGAPRLVRAVDVSAGLALRRQILVDAHSGAIAAVLEGTAGDRERSVCDAGDAPGGVPCSRPVLREGGVYADGIIDVTFAYDHAGAWYDFFAERFGRDSIDGAGMPLAATVRACDASGRCPLDGALWNGSQMVYGAGYAAADDIAAHEMTHGLIDRTAGLLYEGESGAISESLADAFGEFVDQGTAGPGDGPDDAWKIGEAAPGGAVRDMADPIRFGDPDAVDSPLFTTEPGDHGGVHTNSGVGNKAVYLMTVGGSHNGYDVRGLGVDKVARLLYSVETTYLTPGSDYLDLGTYLRYACDELTGTYGFSGNDCVQVRRTVRATRMAGPEALRARLELPLGGVRAGSPFVAHGDGSIAGTDAITSYAWSFSDGATSTDVNPGHTFSAAGPASVTLTVTDRGGKTDTVTRSMVVRRAGSAFVDLPGCLDAALRPTDDESSEPVKLPFALDFFGQRHNALYVNNNGNVTFDQPAIAFTPFALASANVPIIAPFFADVDTRSPKSDVVRYGAASFGGRRAFCVNWDGVAGVGFFNAQGSRLNRFQLLLVDRSDVGAGDFDIYFNYDAIGWEAGDNSGGTNGLGGSTARAGYANGTRAADRALELPGSAVPGAFLDGAAAGLTTTSLNSSVRGRYVLPVRNGQPPGPGRIHGKVRAPTPLGGALVEVCRHAGTACSITRSTVTGAYSVVGLGPGDYDVVAWPRGNDTGHAAGAVEQIHLDAGNDVAVDVDLETLLGGPPAGVLLDATGTLPDGTPILAYDEPVRTSVAGCTGGTGSLALRRRGKLLGRAALGADLTSVVPALAPATGFVTVDLKVSGCREPAGDRTVTFGAYLQPTGRVTTVDGDPVPGALMTLMSGDSPAGPFDVVSAGDDGLAVSQRLNPVVSDASGRYGWDAVAGFYRVTGERNGCAAATGNFGAIPPTLEPGSTVPIGLQMECEVIATVPRAVAFGSRAVGSAAVTRVVSLSTAGLGRFRLGRASVSGPAASDFAVEAAKCAGALVPNGSCDLEISFAPGAAGDRSATLALSANTTSGSHEIDLTGTGVARSQPPDDVLEVAGKVVSGGKPCGGKRGTALRRCRVAQRLKRALDRCGDLRVRVKRVRCRTRARRKAAVTRCAGKPTRAKRARCRVRARRRFA